MSTLVIAQSGGPTAAINATVAGALRAGAKNPNITRILGAKNGIQGVLNEQYLDLTELSKDEEKLALLEKTPSAALGSCRLKLKDLDADLEQFERIVANLKKEDVSAFVYIGGNDSMDTVDKLSQYCKEKDIKDLAVVGAPKTIDNDLCATDHCPGFGSAAKYIATTFAELERDCHVYTTKAVTVVEVMGRNAGWLTAASALSRINGAKGPDMIYLCEKEFDMPRFIRRVQDLFLTQDAVLVAVSEGLKLPDGRYVSESANSSSTDAFGHVQVAGCAQVIADAVKEQLHCKTRAIELNLMQRAASHLASKVDLEESAKLGEIAAEAAMWGESGKMAAIKRTSNKPYKVFFELVDVSKVSNEEKKVPDSMITPDGCDVTSEMMEYLLPLIQGEVTPEYDNGVPQFLHLYD